MSLQPGARLGPYAILSAIGAGGMGEVYRARDTKLNRDVAIKVLPELFASDADRLARFTREAQTLASLNHPNIAIIYGLEQAGEVRALVMELVEGEDLSQRIARGAIPLDEALPIARQIAEALEAAHEQGIIHRDLKPANIKLRPDGTVKVLDFGLAKAMEAVGPGSNLSQSPTITTPAMMTGMGVILGTAAYMAPEQAKGRAADRRADIWAFGAVVFEMLTGQRLFVGETIAETLAAVIKTDPDWRALPVSVPVSLRRLLRRCLEKDPKRRLQAIGEARVQIEDVFAGTPEETGTAIASTVPIWRRALPWGVAAAALIASAVAIAQWAPWRIVSRPAPVRLSSALGADVFLATRFGLVTSISADGSTLAFVAQKSLGESSQLYVRRLTQLQATPLSGTDDADSPFFSPDGKWIGFFAAGKLKKIAVTGGSAVPLCDAPQGRGGAWGEDGAIVFAPNITPGARLMRVSEDGGVPIPLASLEEPAASRESWPQVLPGAKAVLFTTRSGVDRNLVVHTLATGARTVVQRGAYYGRYLATGVGSPNGAERQGGHLLYVRDGTIFAAPFDLNHLAVTGSAVPALEGVSSHEGLSTAQFAVSADGTLVYLPGQSIGHGFPIDWTDREGKTTPLLAKLADQVNIRFAPDGQRLALQITAGQADIWVYDWARNGLTLVTSDPAHDESPVWTPDGRRIVFASDRGEAASSNLYWQRADGSGDAQGLTNSKNRQRPASWDPTGKFLAFTEVNPTTGSDLMILRMEGDETSGWKPGPTRVFLDDSAAEREPMFSPDGRWIAYTSNKTGREEVYVRPFPESGGEVMISTEGGGFPTWSRTKGELFYVLTPAAMRGQVMVVPYRVEGGAFRPEKPRSWSHGNVLVRGTGSVRMFDLHPDGERIALGRVEQLQGVEKQDHLNFIFNFFDELRRIAPATKQ